MILKLLILVTGLSIVIATKFYRKDYNYNQERDAFYKVIWSEQGNNFREAFTACYDEGSQLFYPEDNKEWTIIKDLIEVLPETPNTTDVLLGVRDEVGIGDYIALNGQIITEIITSEIGNCVVMDVNTGTLKATPCQVDMDSMHNSRLFVCKKVDDSPCPTIDSGYKYNEDTKKCYKVNTRKMSWWAALHTCFMEGGLLAVPESDQEANTIYGILPDNQQTTQRFHSGFRKIFDKFYTLKGKTLEDSYSKPFPHGQVMVDINGQYYGNHEEENQDYNQPSLNCGILMNYLHTRLLYTSYSNCSELNPFICEITARI